MKLTSKDSALLLQVKVVPNSSRTQIAGLLGEALKIKVAQPPEDGRANQAVLKLLAEILQLPPSQLAITAGHTRPQKTIQIQGLSLATAELRLNTALNA